MEFDFWDSTDAQVSDMLGKTLVEVTRGLHDCSDLVRFVTDKGDVYVMAHSQACCESVDLIDVNGDFEDLIGSPITMAEESTSDSAPLDEYGNSFTWTFYRFATVKGYVNLRWYGTSNGYYSESVDFRKMDVDHE